MGTSYMEDKKAPNSFTKFTWRKQKYTSVHLNYSVQLKISLTKRCNILPNIQIPKVPVSRYMYGKT